MKKTSGIFGLIFCYLFVVSVHAQLPKIGAGEFAGVSKEDLDAFATAVTSVVRSYVGNGEPSEQLVEQVQNIEGLLRAIESENLQLGGEADSADIRAAINLWNTLLGKLNLILKPSVKLDQKGAKVAVPASPFSGYVVTANGNDEWILFTPDNPFIPNEFNARCSDPTEFTRIENVWMTSEGVVYLLGTGGGTPRLCSVEAPWTTYNCNDLPMTDTNSFSVIEQYPNADRDTILVVGAEGICVVQTPLLDDSTADHCFYPVVPTGSTTLIDVGYYFDNGTPVVYVGSDSGGDGVCKFDLPEFGDFPLPPAAIGECIPNSEGLPDGTHTLFVTNERVYVRESFEVNLVSVRHSDFSNGWDSDIGYQADELFIFEDDPDHIYGNDDYVGSCRIKTDNGFLDTDTNTMVCSKIFIGTSSGSGGRSIIGRNSARGKVMYVASSTPNAFGWFEVSKGYEATVFAPMRSTFNCGNGFDRVIDIHAVE